MASEDEIRLRLENANLRQLLEQAGIDAAQQDVAERLQLNSNPEFAVFIGYAAGRSGNLK